VVRVAARKEQTSSSRRRASEKCNDAVGSICQTESKQGQETSRNCASASERERGAPREPQRRRIEREHGVGARARPTKQRESGGSMRELAWTMRAGGREVHSGYGEQM